MKILIITPFFPYSTVGHAGGKFVYELIKALSKKHEIHLLSRIEPDQSVFVNEMKPFSEHIELLPFSTPRTRNLLSLLLIIYSYLRLGMRANRLMKREGFDLVQVEFLETGLMIKRQPRLPMVIDAHDVITKPAKRRYEDSKPYVIKIFRYCIWKLFKQIERHITGKFDLIFARSKQDKDILAREYACPPITVIPHPVTVPPALDSTRWDEPNDLLFIGDMGREVNVTAALYLFERVLPLVRREFPDIKFYIVGNRPDSRLEALPGIDNDVVVTGFVENLEPYYAKTAVFVSPLFTGGGIIAKNLEAMAFGLPVVTTSIGNEGIEALPDKEVLIANTPQEFAEKVLLLLRDRHAWDTISRNGKAYVAGRFGLERIMNNVEAAYRALLENSNRDGLA